jgi:UTP--glucose-1-phosphate uridylyltransferase
MIALIPAAGLGTRFLPATKATPKEMLPVLNKPAIQYVVEEALAAGASEVIVVSNDDKPSIAQHFSPAPALASRLEGQGKGALAQAVEHAGSLPVGFVPQPEPRGLGHAVLCGREAAGQESFYVLLGDVLVPGNDVLRRLQGASEAHDGASVIAVFRVPEEDVSRFGVIDGTLVSGSEAAGTGVWRVNALVEKPPADEAPSNLAIFGRYLLTPKVMEILERTKPGAGGEIQLTDALAELLQSEAIYAVEVATEEGFDTGTVASWLETNIRLALRDPALASIVQAAAATKS